MIEEGNLPNYNDVVRELKKYCIGKHLTVNNTTLTVIDIISTNSGVKLVFDIPYSQSLHGLYEQRKRLEEQQKQLDTQLRELDKQILSYKSMHDIQIIN